DQGAKREAGSTHQVTRLGISPDGRTATFLDAWGVRLNPRLLGTAYRSQQWDLTAGKLLAQRRHGPNEVHSSLWSPDGKVSLSVANALPGPWGKGGKPQDACGACTVVLHDAFTGRQLLAIGQPDEFDYREAFAPDGQTLVTLTRRSRQEGRRTFSKHTLRLWELATGKERLA